MAKTVAVVPAFNEEGRIGAVVKGAKRHVGTVLVVDDGSRDGTAEQARKAGAKVVRLAENRGAGFATRKGAGFAIARMGAGRLVFIDADGQHNPADIPRILKGLGNGCDVVFTFRKRAGMSVVKRFGNWWLTLFTRLLTGVNISDSQSGFKAMKSGAFKKMRLRARRYEICSEIVFKVGQKGLKYCEVPIETLGPASSKKGTGIRDGVGIFVRMLGMRLRS